MADEQDEAADFGVSNGWPLSGRQTVAVAVALVAAIFVVQNTDEVTVDVFTVSVVAPLWLVLTVQFVIGALVGVLLQRRRQRD